MPRRKKVGHCRRRQVWIAEANVRRYDSLTPEQLSQIINAAIARSLRPKAGSTRSQKKRVDLSA